MGKAKSSKIFFTRHKIRLVHRQQQINLSNEPKRSSPLSQPPRVWYWQACEHESWASDKAEAIAAAKQYINHELNKQHDHSTSGSTEAKRQAQSIY